MSPRVMDGELSACTVQGWRPVPGDQETKALAASILAPRIGDWIDRRRSDAAQRSSEKSTDLASQMLIEMASDDEDGYRLARKLEDAYGIEPTAELVDILDQWNVTLGRATSDLEKEKAAKLGIEAPFGFAAKAVYTDSEGNRIDGIAFRIADEQAARVAFVSDEEPMDEGPLASLSVLSVELERVDVTGPAPERAASLHPFVLDAIADYENQVLVERMEQIAESDMAVLDVEIRTLADEQVTAGGEPLSIYMEMSDRFSRAFEEAMEADRFEEAWVAGIMATTAMRRTAILVGMPPQDTDRMHDLMTKVSDYLEGGSSAPKAAKRAIRLLH